MADLVDLAQHRPPVPYTIELLHFWDGHVEVAVHGIGDSDLSRQTCADTLRKAADQIDPKNGLIAEKVK